MKISISKKALSDALKNVSSVINSKATLPITTTVLLKTMDGKLQLSATDLDMYSKTLVDAKIVEEGEITIPCKKFEEIINKLIDGEIIITSNAGNKSTIECGKSKFTMFGLNSEDFPQIEMGDTKYNYEISGDVLTNSLNKIRCAASLDEARIILTGVLFSIRNGLLILAATDGRRLAIVENSIDVTEEADNDAVVPMKTINEIIKTIGNDKKVTIKVAFNQISFETDTNITISKLLDGNFPNFRSVIPTQFTSSVVMPRKEFLETINRLVTISQESIKINILPTQMELSSTAADLGDAAEPVNCDYNGNDIEIFFNPKILTEPLKNLQCDNLIMQINDKLSPVAIKGDEGFLYITVPMRGQ